jgi:hypothetical protein
VAATGPYFTSYVSRRPQYTMDFRSSKKLKNHSTQEIISNKHVTFRIDTFVKSDIKIKHNRFAIIVIDKRAKKIFIVEVGIHL